MKYDKNKSQLKVTRPRGLVIDADCDIIAVLQHAHSWVSKGAVMSASEYDRTRKKDDLIECIVCMTLRSNQRVQPKSPLISDIVKLMVSL
jgi:hypothetical protein